MTIKQFNIYQCDGTVCNFNNYGLFFRQRSGGCWSVYINCCGKSCTNQRFLIYFKKQRNEIYVIKSVHNRILLLLLLLLKEVGNARLGERDYHPISPKTPTPQHQPIERKKRKGKQ